MNLLDFIWQRESSQGKDPNKMATGGDYQLKRIMYEDVNRLSKEARKKGWTYEQVINDPAKGRYYTKKAFSVVFPHYIKAWKLPNTMDIKIAMWNWGVGNVHQAKGDLSNAPSITKAYINAYHQAFNNTLLTGGRQ